MTRRMMTDPEAACGSALWLKSLVLSLYSEKTATKSVLALPKCLKLGAMLYRILCLLQVLPHMLLGLQR